MVILMDNENKSLQITKRSTIYKYETGVDIIKFIIPPTMNDIDISQLRCIVLVTAPNSDGTTRGLFKYLSYDKELYKNRLSTSIPVTTTLTKNVGEVKIWLLFLKANAENPKLAENVIETSYTTFDIIDNGSKYMESEEGFDEIWEHSSIDSLKKDVDTLTKEVDKKADTIAIEDRNVIILKSGNDILCSVQLDDDVKWEEWGD